MNYQQSLRNFLKTRLSRQIRGKHIDFIYLSDHDDLNLDLIKEYPDALWDWEAIQNHDKFGLEWLIAFPDAPWDWSTMHYAEKFDKSWLMFFSHKQWSWHGMHNCEKFNMEWVEQNVGAQWDWNRLSERAKIEDLKRWPHFPWMWDVVTAYSDINAKTMMDNLQLPWDVSLIRFDEVTQDEIGFLRHFMYRFPVAAWHDFTQCASWNVIKRNRDLLWIPSFFHFEPEEFEEHDIDFLLSYPIEQHNWVRLSMNVPFSVIKKHLDLPWIFEWVSANETVHWKDANEYPKQDWDWSVIPCEPIEQCLLKWVSASKIKRAWRNAISNPKYRMCRIRLDKEKKEFTTTMTSLYERAR